VRSTAGDDTIIDLTSTVAYTGTFNGTSIVRGILIFHADGSATFHDVETFTGEVDGVSGTVTFDLRGGSPAPADAGLSYEGTAVVVGGTGDLASLRGVVRQIGAVQDKAKGPFGTYTGQVQYREGVLRRRGQRDADRPR
jgi:hypothetical protein